jgi:predicted DNA-binding transcriptional regulator YafY
MDAIESVALLEEPAFEAPPMEGTGYGIFSGAAVQTAKLIFEESASRWVANETWHPQQVMTPLPEGRMQLEVPFSHSQEILMDILRHGPNVEVVAPRSLRSEVAAAHREAALRYEAPRKAMAAGSLEMQRTGTA